LFSKRSGFTLLELIVVMAVISILLAIGIPNYVSYTKDAAVSTMQVDAGLLEQAAIHSALVCGDNSCPVSGVYEPDDSVLAIIENVLRRKGASVQAFSLRSAGIFRELSEAELSPYIRSVNNPLSEYFIVDFADGIVGYSNELRGMVFSKRVFEDRDGVFWSGMWCIEDVLIGLRKPESDEFEVWTDSDLCKVGSGEDGWNMDSKYIQMSHIDLSGYADGEGWEPIGDDMDNMFAGSFDGNGLTISNLTINRPADYQGLFGCMDSGAKLSNISLEFVNVKGNQYVGGLVGYNHGTITSSYSTASVEGDRHVGGLVGWNWGGVIASSYSTGSVKGTLLLDDFDFNNVGGLVGRNNGEITSSYSTASVEGDQWHVGGLVGMNSDGGRVISSYSTGSVKGDNNYVGGLVGYNYGKIASSYSTGFVEGDWYVGGLVGWNYEDKGEIASSYWDTETSGQSESAGGGEGKTTAEMKQQATFEGWDFGIVWGIDEGNSYPYLLDNE
jgi:prepilin-type N-terminal cleavage/methylation domain-containing protein